MSDVDPIAIVGLGRIGLALAGFYLRRGYAVIGCDIDPVKLSGIAEGEIARQEEGLADAIRAGERDGRLRTTTDAAEAAGSARTTIVIVPVHAHEGDIDLGALHAVAKSVVPALRTGSLLIVETTVPVGTTRRLFWDPLTRRGRAGVHVAYSPERVNVGRVFLDLGRYPKIVGGADEASGEHAAAFYGEALGGAEVRRVGPLETAEFVKLIETTYRFVNIALADEFAHAAELHGIDVNVAIDAANSQPFSHVHTPGIGVGGNCIPVYPHFFEAGDPSATLPRASRQVVDGMVDRAVRELETALGSLHGRRVLILGVAYRPGVKDASNSPATSLARRLGPLGAKVSAVDPLFSAAELASFGLNAGDLSAEHDALVLVTAHHEYLDPRVLASTGAKVVIDGRNALDPGVVTARGARYVGMGRPSQS